MTRTTRLEDLKPSRTNDRVAPGECVTLQTVQWFGTDAVEVIYKRAAGEHKFVFSRTRFIANASKKTV